MYALGKMSGKANIENNLKELGIELPEEDQKKVTQRIIELGDRKETVTQADLPYIISDVLDSSTIEEKVKIINYMVCAKDLKPLVSLKICVNGLVYEESAFGDGQYDAFMNAVKNLRLKRKELPSLLRL